MNITKRQLSDFLLLHFSESAFIEREAAIYYFAEGYHSGQFSPLYSILSTSQFRPHPYMTLEKESEKIQTMFTALADNFFPSIKE